ncbi:MAG TPA: DUF3887 domain-containing protein [Oscillatoriaceae cyanobacterium M33_DOE_052]|uniref:DUF3887 domain-containing protein n=1 Tax=Planktothricoides sp. SpSt-374 TaxID=2282167 RepID=A0A7C3ZVL7_9CYAN|nr:DUF3887 domain-containing protein [Oscillatoriaceae cyanobacterium M33_DOE_052]
MKNQLAVLLLSAILTTGVAPAYAAPLMSPSPQVIAQADAREKIAEEFVDMLVKGDTRNALERYDSTIRENITPQSLGDMWSDLINETGPFEKRTSIRSDGNMTIVSCEFEKGKRDLFIIFNDANKIVGLDYVQPQ